MDENTLLEGLWLRIVKDGDIISHQRLNEKTFDRLKRLLELIESDEDALRVLDKAIRIMEAPKRKIAETISNRLLDLETMPGMLQEALMVLPMVHLKDMESSLDELKLRREPGGDCLYIEYGDESRRINL